jgi:hypothetical protein
VSAAVNGAVSGVPWSHTAGEIRGESGGKRGVSEVNGCEWAVTDVHAATEVSSRDDAAAGSARAATARDTGGVVPAGVHVEHVGIQPRAASRGRVGCGVR